MPSPATSTPAPLTPLPDLRLGRFIPTQVASGRQPWVVPVEVLIQNIGAADAGPFAMLVTADGDPVVFQVDNEAQVPHLTTDPLAAGEELLLVGDVVLGRDYAPDTVVLEAEADTCEGLEDPAEYCRIQEEREDNNRLRLQAIDLRVSELTIGEPRLPTEPVAFVPLSLTLANNGNIAAEAFWVTAYVGQLQPPLTIEGYETPANGAVTFESLDVAEVLALRAMVAVPADFLSQQLVIVAGCAPRVDPCLLPEIYIDNNSMSGEIPAVVQVTPSPLPIQSPTAPPPAIP